MKLPDSSHPIVITPAVERVRVFFGGAAIADSRKALALRETSYPLVYYLPREDVDFSALVRTDHATHCPYKGDAAYYSIATGGRRAENAAWTYEAPYSAVAPIAGYLAFYPKRVERIELLPLDG